MATKVEMGRQSRGPRRHQGSEDCREMVEALLRERGRLLQAPPAACENLPDSIDEAREREEEAVWTAILDRSHDVQKSVEEALRRLATGEYGCCVECGEHIALARLRVLPFAVRCLSCQNRLERERGDRAIAGPREWHG